MSLLEGPGRVGEWKEEGCSNVDLDEEGPSYKDKTKLSQSIINGK